MKRNYQQELDQIIAMQGEARPRLLLHSCCGPCSSSVLEYLTQYFDVTLFWYNPNIYPQAEFDRRLDAQRKLLDGMGLADRVPVAVVPRDAAPWDAAVAGLAVITLAVGVFSARAARSASACACAKRPPTRRNRASTASAAR